MPVSSSEAERAHPLTHGVRVLLLSALALAAAFAFSPTPAGAAPKLLKKTKIVAPTNDNYVRGTLNRTKCYVKFPAQSRSAQITVTGPLSTRKPKSKKLKVSSPTVKRKVGSKTKKVKDTKKVNCTWKTKSFKDGTYRFTVKAKVRANKKWWTVSLKRSVVVRNAAAAPSTAQGPKLGVGNARYVGRLETQWDDWLTGADASRKAWMREHMWQLVAHTPFFDSMTSWAPPTLLYKDLYAIYRNDPATLAAHPEWVLKNAAGERMVIPWGCDPGPCPQFAGDIGNPAFRAEWIRQALVSLGAGYLGLWIDDANMEMRVANENGIEAQPIDPRTGQLMTYANYRRYVAEFLEEIRRAIPNKQLVANVLWFGGTSIGRDVDPYIIRAYTTVDRLNLERGFNDDGLTGGKAPRDIWAVDTFMQFIDRMHDRGIPVTLDSAGYGVDAWEYNLAGFFLVDRGEDAVGELRLKPGEWWNGWDIQIGGPLGERTRGTDGVFRRSFTKGLVLLNPPRGAAKTVTLPRAMKRIDGTTVTKVTLQSGRGAVLLG
ncbi:MAG: hypothetical protein JHD16_12665 [Solirubrobacteraceae bacterium]|nr:hypothetical protein [Solirubrobacteraceae bacterium]